MQRHPTFLVIGAAKSGTTSLHEYLRQHPDVFVPRPKEPSFFAAHALQHRIAEGQRQRGHPRTWVTTWDRYLGMFADAGDTLAVGEVSPAYMSVPGSAQTIHQRLPGVRLVAILRDPAERAFSHWLMRRKVGDYHPVFGREIDRQVARLDAGDESFLWHGFYNRQLAPYVELFGRSRLHVLRFEDLRRDARPTMRPLYRFIGVGDRSDELDLRVANAGGMPRHPLLAAVIRAERYVAHKLPTTVPAALKHLNARALTSRDDMPTLQPDDRERLEELYRHDMRALATLLSLDLTGWEHVSANGRG